MWGCSSVVERLVRNQKVAGSSPVSSRSTLLFRHLLLSHWQQPLNAEKGDICRMWKMALGHDGLLHEVLGLLANLFPGCPSAQKAFASSGNPSLLQRTLILVNKPNLELPTLEVHAGLCTLFEPRLSIYTSCLYDSSVWSAHHHWEVQEGSTKHHIRCCSVSCCACFKPGMSDIRLTVRICCRVCMTRCKASSARTSWRHERY